MYFLLPISTGPIVALKLYRQGMVPIEGDNIQKWRINCSNIEMVSIKIKRYKESQGKEEAV